MWYTETQSPIQVLFAKLCLINIIILACYQFLSRSWTCLVLMYFVVSVTNNYALNFNISMPLHMIFRAGSLMANMVLGMILLGKRYTTTKYLSVIMISIGIATCTIMSSQDVKKSAASDAATAINATEAMDDSLEVDDLDNVDPWEFFEWTIGISMLTFALFVSARMGIYQEVVYGKYGKHPKEALFYSVINQPVWSS